MTGEPVDLLVNGQHASPAARSSRSTRSSACASRTSSRPSAASTPPPSALRVPAPARRCQAPRQAPSDAAASSAAATRRRRDAVHLDRACRARSRRRPRARRSAGLPSSPARWRSRAAFALPPSDGCRDAHLPAVAVAPGDRRAARTWADAQLRCAVSARAQHGAELLRRRGAAAARRESYVSIRSFSVRRMEREDLRHARLADAEHAADLGALHVLARRASTRIVCSRSLSEAIASRSTAARSPASAASSGSNSPDGASIVSPTSTGMASSVPARGRVQAEQVGPRQALEMAVRDRRRRSRARWRARRRWAGGRCAAATARGRARSRGRCGAASAAPSPGGAARP